MRAKAVIEATGGETPRRCIPTPQGRFFIANDNHPAKQVGEEVTVSYDPQDQFATIVEEPQAFTFGEHKDCCGTGRTNGQRADHAQVALLAYLGNDHRAQIGDESYLQDLISDLLHLCDLFGFDGEDLLDSAKSRWEEER